MWYSSVDQNKCEGYDCEGVVDPNSKNAKANPVLCDDCHTQHQEERDDSIETDQSY